MLVETRVTLFQSGWELAAMADLTKVIRALPEDIEKAGISTMLPWTYVKLNRSLCN